MLKKAFTDDQLYAREFNSGDIVRKAGLHGNLLSPFSGRVIYSSPDIGRVSVQWPWGVEQETASELIHDGTTPGRPSQMDQSYHTWESSRNINSPNVVEADAKWRKTLASSIVSKYETKTLPLYRAACEAWYCGMGEVDTYVKMASVFGPEFGTDAIRITISNVYEAGRRLAIYWKNNKRKYRVTQRELKTGVLQCPRCKNSLKPRVYRQGNRVFQCKTCGFTIHPKDCI